MQLVKKIKGICILILTFFSFCFTVLFMPLQVYGVFSTLDSQVVEAEVIYSKFDRNGKSGFNKRGCIIEVELKILSNNENITIIDVKPGDISTCSSMEKYASEYKAGDFTTVYLSKGGKYFLRLGSYVEALTPTFFSLLWLVFLYRYIKKQRKPDTSL